MFLSLIIDVSKCVKNNKFFFFPYLFFVILGLSFISSFTKFEIALFINKLNSIYLDIFFKYITSFGEEIIIFPILILSSFFISYKKLLLFIPCYLVSGGITQFLKRFIFENWHRPSILMKDFDIHTVEGVELANHFSFPSGHTTIAFAFWSFMCIMVKNKKLGVIFLLISFLVAYSRMYLMQHFLEDVILGSFIGVFTSLILINAYNLYKKK